MHTLLQMATPPAMIAVVLNKYADMNKEERENTFTALIPSIFGVDMYVLPAACEEEDIDPKCPGPLDKIRTLTVENWLGDKVLISVLSKPKFKHGLDIANINVETAVVENGTGFGPQRSQAHTITRSNSRAIELNCSVEEDTALQDKFLRFVSPVLHSYAPLPPLFRPKERPSAWIKTAIFYLRRVCMCVRACAFVRACVPCHIRLRQAPCRCRQKPQRNPGFP